MRTRFVARLAAAQPIVLLYGPDAGLVREARGKDHQGIGRRRERSVRAGAARGRRARVGAVAAGRGGAHRAAVRRQARRVGEGGSRQLAAAVEAVVNAPPSDCRIVIEAGDLRRTAPLRTMCEKAQAAAAIGCYIDGEADLGRLVDDEMRQAKLTDRAGCARRIGVADRRRPRRASRGEIRCSRSMRTARSASDWTTCWPWWPTRPRLALDAVIDSAFAGKIADLETQFAKALAAGTAPGTMMSGALRFIAQLHKARLAIDGGDSTDEAMRAFIPPVHFTRRSAVEGALRSWTSPRLGARWSSSRKPRSMCAARRRWRRLWRNELCYRSQ